MKINQQENIRLLLFLGLISTSIVSKETDVHFINELNKYMVNNGIDPESLNDVMNQLFSIATITMLRFERLTTDYKDLKDLYNQVINNYGNFAKYLNCADDPVKLFALFVYMYRSGYLSVNKDFKYDTDMKDYSLLLGIDVIRGTGVCRSISSMFTDVCNNVGIKSKNIAVSTTSEDLKKKEQLSSINLAKSNRSGRFVSLVVAFTKYLPLANHLVTICNHEGRDYVLDPTNDVFMYRDKYNKFVFANDTSAKMTYRYCSNLVAAVFGNFNPQLIPNNITKLPIDYEAYKEIYLETLSFIENNKALLEDFYLENQSLYQAITDISNEHNSFISRYLPIISVGKKIGGYRKK